MINKQRRQPHNVSIVALWFGLLGGALAWGLRLVISYAVVPLACVQGWQPVLHALSIFFLVVALAATLVARRSGERLRRQEEGGVEGQPPDDPIGDEWSWKRTRFMAQLGLLMSGFFAVVILAEWATTLFIAPCVVR